MNIYKFGKKIIETVEKFCINNHNCYKPINLNSYCCNYHCCNMLEYIIRNE